MKKYLKPILALILALVLAVSCCSCGSSTTLLTVDGNIITEEIMNYYAYISTSMLELYYEGALDYSAEIDEFDGQTLGEVVKRLAYEQILIDYATLMLAREHGLEFTEKEMELVEEQVNTVIANIGDNATYIKFLNTLNVSDKTYRQMLKNQLLAQKVENFLVEEDGPMALTADELAAASETFKENYVNVEYILLSSLDLETGEALDSTSVAQQKELAKKVRALAVTGSNFHNLADKYTASPVDGYSAYIKEDDSDIPDEFIDAAFALEENEISSVVVTDYGFYIIKRLPFDDYFTTVATNDAKQEKFDKVIKEAQERMSIVTTSAYNKYVIE
ncbi:MAG: peptidylprolyl isomerase [Clostridia bacterium]|nr:peptidylprolyl isomerase [Clostridia bacterium]